jgi:hypothetical protein
VLPAADTLSISASHVIIEAAASAQVRGPYCHYARSISAPIGMFHIKENGAKKNGRMAPSCTQANAVTVHDAAGLGLKTVRTSRGVEVASAFSIVNRLSI